MYSDWDSYQAEKIKKHPDFHAYAIPTTEPDTEAASSWADPDLESVTPLTPHCFSYWSNTEATNNNNKFSFEFIYPETIIACRHLAFAFLVSEARRLREGFNKQHPHYYRRAFVSAGAMNRLPELATPVFDDKDIHCKASRCYLIEVACLTPKQSLGQVLHRVCSDMIPGAAKFFLLSSGSHAMAVIVRYKKAENGVLNYFSVKFYDPNITLSCYRFVANSFEELQYMSLLVVFEKLGGKFNRYFATHTPKPYAPHGLLAEYDNILDSFDSPPEATTDRLIRLGGETNLLLASSLHLFMRFGFNIDDTVDRIKRAIITEEQRMRFLAAKNKAGTPGLYMALYCNHLQVVETYMRSVLDSELSEENKKELLTAKSEETRLSGLSAALRKGHTQIVTVYSDIISKSTLKEDSKAELLAENRSFCVVM